MQPGRRNNSRVSRSRRRLAFAALLLTLTTRHAAGQLVNENLLITFPQGFRVANDQKANGVHLSEMIPKGESIDDWSQMVTVQIFFGAPAMTTPEFEANMETGWKATCPGASKGHVADGLENNYRFSLWIQSCPRNPATGKPETTFFKAIAGNDSFYLVQKAFRSKPTMDEVGAATAWLRKIEVCDSRRPEHACPKPAQ